MAPTPSANLFLPVALRPFNPPQLDHLLITEVMVDPDGTPDQGDVEWIELYNPTGAKVPLAEYKIGDEETIGGPEAMLKFPPASSIAPGQVILIAGDALAFQSAYGFPPDFETADSGSAVPDMIKYAAWANGSLSLSNSADEILLIDLVDQQVDSLSWGSSTWAFDPAVPASGKGNTLERFPAYRDSDSAEDWRALAVPSPGDVDLSPPTPTPSPPGPSPTPFGGGLLISEVLYDPQAAEPGAEWIEIYNDTGMMLDLYPFKIGDEESSGQSEGMYRFPAGAVAPPGAVLLIANRADAFQAANGFPPDFELADSDPAAPDMAKYTTWSSGSMSLGNTGDEIVLLDNQDRLVDALSWGNSIWAFDPAAPDVVEGHSLERMPAYRHCPGLAGPAQPDPGRGGYQHSNSDPHSNPDADPISRGAAGQ